MAERDYGPGCPRHEGDPHNLCPKCWELEPDDDPNEGLGFDPFTGNGVTQEPTQRV